MSLRQTVHRLFEIILCGQRLQQLTHYGQHGEHHQPIPAQWPIYPSIPTECPRRRDIFIAFAITNLVTTVLGLAVGCRPFIYTITCHMFGKKKRKNV